MQCLQGGCAAPHGTYQVELGQVDRFEQILSYGKDFMALALHTSHYCCQNSGITIH